MSGRPNGNGDGRGGRANGGGGQDVPHWVRTLFDDHERLLTQMKAEHEERMDEMERLRKEDKAAHEARMDRLERGLLDTRRLTARVVDVMGAYRRDHLELVRGHNQLVRGHNQLMQLVREVHGRVVRLETPGRKG